MPNHWDDIRYALDVSKNFTDMAGTPWYSDAVYPKFSPEEYERRHTVARRYMADHGLDALLLTGGQNIYSMGSGVTWAGGLIDSRGLCQYLLLPREGAPSLVYPHPGCHIEAARRMVAVDDVLDGRHGHYGQVVADRLADLGLARGRVGVTVADRTGEEYLGHHAYETIRQALPDLEIVFLPDALHRFTLTKSAEELAAMRVAGRLAIAGLEAVRAVARPGVTEYQLAAAATNAIVGGGGQIHLIMIGSTSMAAPTIVFPNPLPSARVLGEGDIILSEISAMYMGYSAKIGQPISVGAPTVRYREFHEQVVLPGFRAIESEIYAGNGLEAVQKAGGRFRAAGAQSRPILMHGLDLITADPFVMTDRIRAADYESTFIENMTVNIEITPISAEGDLGIFLSRSFAVTDASPDQLTPYPIDEILIAG